MHLQEVVRLRGSTPETPTPQADFCRELRARETSLSGSIFELQHKVSSFEGRLDRLQDSTLSQPSPDPTQQLQDFRSEILALRQKFACFGDRFSEVQGQFSELRFRFDGLEARVDRSLERLGTCFAKNSREIENMRFLRLESGTGETPSSTLGRFLATTQAGQLHRREAHREERKDPDSGPLFRTPEPQHLDPRSDTRPHTPVSQSMYGPHL